MEEVVGAARAGQVPHCAVQLKADTGLGRGGYQLARTGRSWSRPPCAPRRRGTAAGPAGSGPTSPAPPSPVTLRRRAQLTRFREMAAYAGQVGPAPRCGIANSPATLTPPDAPLRPRAVRPASPMLRHLAQPRARHPADFGLRPVMTLSFSSLALVKQVPGRRGVSYGASLRHPGETTLGLVPARLRGRRPLRHASVTGPRPGRRQVAHGRGADRHGPVRRRPGRGPSPRPGAEAVLFGPGDRGEPTAEDWAQAAGHHRVRNRHADRKPRSARLRQRVTGPPTARPGGELRAAASAQRPGYWRANQAKNAVYVSGAARKAIAAASPPPTYEGRQRRFQAPAFQQDRDY